MLIIYTIILCVLMILGLKWLKSLKKFIGMMNDFPGPETTFLLGNVLCLTRDPLLMFKKLREYSKKYKTYRFWAWYEPTVHIVTPEDAEKLLSSTVNLRKGEAYRYLHPWLGRGMLLATVEKWRKRRKMLTPTFHFTILQKYFETILDHSECFARKLQKECGQEKTDVIPLIEEHTLCIFCETSMGTTLDPNDEEHKIYMETVKEAISIISKRLMKPWLYTDFVFYSLPIGWNLNKCIKIMKNFTKKVIQERERVYIENRKNGINNEGGENVSMVDDIEYNGKKRLALLDLLLKEKIENNSIDNEGILEEVDTFMVAGHDTTAVALGYLFILLANHPNVQEKIVDEIRDIKGGIDRKITFSSLQQMRYLEMVIKESIRLYPSASFIARHIEKEIKLENGTIPVGCQAVLHFYDVHRDPRHYSDPEKFDPERFTPENSKNRHPYAFIPFSAGPRNCIGQKFGMLTMKSTLSNVLWNYKLESVQRVEDLKILFDIMLRHDGPLYVKFVKREHENGTEPKI